MFFERMHKACGIVLEAVVENEHLVLHDHMVSYIGFSHTEPTLTDMESGIVDT